MVVGKWCGGAAKDKDGWINQSKRWAFLTNRESMWREIIGGAGYGLKRRTNRRAEEMIMKKFESVDHKKQM